jgi:hypothetical protein
MDETVAEAYVLSCIPWRAAGTEAMARTLLGPDLVDCPVLFELASAFAGECHGTIAPSTAASYARPWHAFELWYAQTAVGGSAITATGVVVAMYLMKIWQESKADNIGPSRVLTASHAIRHYITTYGLVTPTDHPLCISVRELANRHLHATRRVKDALDHHDLSLLVAHYARPGANLMDLMHVTAIVLMYTALLRFDDVAEVCVHKDLLIIKPTHLEIFIPRSKTDKYWEGTWTVAAALPNRIECPVRLVRRLFAEGGYVTHPAHPGEDVGPLPATCASRSRRRPPLATASGHQLQARLHHRVRQVSSASRTDVRDCRDHQAHHPPQYAGWGCLGGSRCRLPGTPHYEARALEVRGSERPLRAGILGPTPYGVAFRMVHVS